MKKVSLIHLALALAIFAPRPVFAQSGSVAKGCIIFKPGNSAVPLIEEFTSFVDYGTNISIKTVAGDTIRIFQSQNPIAVPYPTDETATPDSAAIALQKARVVLPRAAKRWDAIAALWAAKASKTAPPMAQTDQTPKVHADSDKNAAGSGKIVKLLSGGQLVNPVVQSRDDLSARITHADGSGTFQWSEFSKGDQLAFGYVREEAIARTEDARKRAIADAEARKIALQKERANMIATVHKRLKAGNITLSEIVEALRFGSKFDGVTSFDTAKELFGLPDTEVQKDGISGSLRATVFTYRKLYLNPNTGRFDWILLIIDKGLNGEESYVSIKTVDGDQEATIVQSVDKNLKYYKKPQ